MEEGVGEAKSAASRSGVELREARLGARCGHHGAASDWARRKKIAFVIFRWTIRGACWASPQA
jgi:hypothetical protein